MSAATTPSKRARPWWRSGWLLAVVLTAIVVAAVVTALPVVARHLAQGWLHAAGAADASIDDIDFNPFNGRLAVTGLRADGGGRKLTLETLAVDVDWWPLTQRRAFVRTIALTGLDADVDLSPSGVVQVGGITLPMASADADPDTTPSAWQIGFEGVTLERVALRLQAEPVRARFAINRLQVGAGSQWQPETATPLEAQVELDDARVLINASLLPFADQLQLRGRLQVDGLDLARYQPLLADSGITDLRGQVSSQLDLTASLHSDGTLQASSDGNVVLSTFGAGLEGNTVASQRAELRGAVVLRQPAAAGEPMVSYDGSVELTDLDLASAAPAVQVRQGGIRWQGQVTLTADDAALGTPGAPTTGGIGVSADGSLELTNLDLTSATPAVQVRQDGIRWQGQVTLSGDGTPGVRGALETTGTAVSADGVTLALGASNTQGIDVRGLDQVAIADVQLQQLAVTDGQATARPVLAAANVAISTIAASAAALDIASVTVSRLGIDATLRADGSVAIIEALERLGAPAPEAPADAIAAGIIEAAPAPTEATAAETAVAVEEVPEVAVLAWSLGRFVVEPEGSELRVTDLSIQPRLQTTLSPIALTLEDLASDARPVQVDLQAGQGDTMSFRVTGNLTPLAEKVSGKLDLKLQGLNLPQFSAYVPGYRLDQGRLTLDSTIVIDNDVLDVNNRFNIERLKLVAKAGDEVPFLSEGLAMPLDVVLDLLRDRNDRIRVQVPISGDIRAPDFDTGPILRRAVRGALQKAAVAYVKNVLQPLGTLLMVGEMAGKAMRPRFDPVLFEPGEATLNPVASEYVASIAKLLTERPRLSLTLCGVSTSTDSSAIAATLAAAAAPATPADDAVLDAAPDATLVGDADAPAEPLPAALPAVSPEELLALAEQRAQNVRKHLATQHGLAADRLFACFPQTDKDAAASPRVDVTL